MPSSTQTRTGKLAKRIGQKSNGCIAAAASAPKRKTVASASEPSRSFTRCGNPRIIVQSTLLFGFRARRAIGRGSVNSDLLHAPGVRLRHLEFDAARVSHKLTARRHAAEHGKDQAAERIGLLSFRLGKKRLFEQGLNFLDGGARVGDEH